MATKKATNETPMRHCVGSKTFGIAPHDAPVGDFPTQPSRKDRLGVMCREHWTLYTRSLRQAAKARRAAGETTPKSEAVAKAATKRERRRSPMAHVPTSDAADVPSSIERFVAKTGGSLPPAKD